MDKNELKYLFGNAALRCEQRYHVTQPYHLKHETQRWNTNAKRWESLLNALLCSGNSILHCRHVEKLPLHAPKLFSRPSPAHE